MKNQPLPAIKVPFVLALLLLIFSHSQQSVMAQSDVCQDRNNDAVTCEDGFTCAYSFGGGELYERFTFRITESGNTNGSMSTIVFFNGEPATVSEKSTVNGEAMSWTKLSSGEGDSFFRVQNTNSSGDISALITCNRADTELSDSTDAGVTVIDVADIAPFGVGDSIVVNPGGPTEEKNVVTGFGSLQLATPLQFAHSNGETVVSIGAGPTTTSTRESPGSISGMEFEIYPNPARDEATIVLTSPSSQITSVSVYDVLGRRVGVLHEGPLTPVEHQFSFEIGNHPAGIYLVRVSSPSGVLTKSLTLIR